MGVLCSWGAVKVWVGSGLSKKGDSCRQEQHLGQLGAGEASQGGSLSTRFCADTEHQGLAQTPQVKGKVFPKTLPRCTHESWGPSVLLTYQR